MIITTVVVILSAWRLSVLTRRAHEYAYKFENQINPIFLKNSRGIK